MEIAGGLLSIAGGFVFFDGGWPRWLLVGLGIFSLLPWVGPAAILRRGERDPSILISDPERRRRRARRFALAMVPFAVVAGTVIGYVGGGWGGAAVVAVLCGVSGLLGVWWVWRWSK